GVVRALTAPARAHDRAPRGSGPLDRLRPLARGGDAPDVTNRHSSPGAAHPARYRGGGPAPSRRSEGARTGEEQLCVATAAARLAALEAACARRHPAADR